MDIIQNSVLHREGKKVRISRCFICQNSVYNRCDFFIVGKRYEGSQCTKDAVQLLTSKVFIVSSDICGVDYQLIC